MIWILLIWLIVLSVKLYNTKTYLKKAIKVIDEIFAEKQDQINDLYSKIDKDDEII